MRCGVATGASTIEKKHRSAVGSRGQNGYVDHTAVREVAQISTEMITFILSYRPALATYCTCWFHIRILSTTVVEKEQDSECMESPVRNGHTLHFSTTTCEWAVIDAEKCLEELVF